MHCLQHCSSTSPIYANGIKVESERIHSSFFFTPDTSALHSSMCMRVCVCEMLVDRQSGACLNFKLELYAQTNAVNKHAVIFRRAEIISKG